MHAINLTMLHQPAHIKSMRSYHCSTTFIHLLADAWLDFLHVGINAVFVYVLILPDRFCLTLI